MRRRCQNKKKMNVESFDDEDYNIAEEDSLNEDYVENKRAVKKGGKGARKAAKKPTKKVMS